MNDQARQLREMVLQEALHDPGHMSPGDVGETVTRIRFLPANRVACAGIALNVAMALARRGVQVVLATPADWVLASRYDCFGSVEWESSAGTDTSDALADASIAIGPFGVRLVELSGLELVDGPVTDRAWAQLGEILVDLRPPLRVSRSGAEDLQVYLTATDNASILDTYALVKSETRRGPALLIANEADTEEAGWDALQRICRASSENGDRRVVPITVMTTADGAALALGARPALLKSPNGSLSKRLDVIAECLLAERHFVANPTAT